MDPVILILIFVAVFALVNVAVGWFILRRIRSGEGGGEGLMLLQNQIQELSRTLDARVSESGKQMHEVFRAQAGEANRLIKEITQEITTVKEIGRETGKFAEQLKSLQDILKNPKQRGVLGEYYLETVLKNVLPPGMYRMQHPFRDGTIVDAVVYVNERVIPIDSKFSLENYNRLVSAHDADKPALEKVFVNDLKLRIQETAKYIRPEEGTMDFAFMFIPSEGIYYDLLNNSVGADENESLIQRAASKYKVIIVSPTSFLAYLQTVLQGLKAMQIEKKVDEVIGRVEDLRKHLGAYSEYHSKLGNALGTVVNHFNASGREFRKIDKDILRITGSHNEFEPLVLEKPSQE